MAEGISINDDSFFLLCPIVLMIIWLLNFVENDGSCFILCEAISNGKKTSLIIITSILKLRKDSIYLLSFPIKEQLLIYMCSVIENNVSSNCGTYNKFSISIIYIYTLIKMAPIPVTCNIVSPSTKHTT